MKTDLAFGMLFLMVYSGLMVGLHGHHERSALKHRDEKVAKPRVFEGIRLRWRHHLRIKNLKQPEISKSQQLIKLMTKLMHHRAHNLKGRNLAVGMLLSATLGWCVGAVVENLFLQIVLASVGLSLPLIYLQNVVRNYERDRNDKLLVVLSNLQAEYMKPHVPFVHAVTQILPTIPDPLYQPFKKYADTINLFHPDCPTEALKVLEQSVDNYFFTEYICLAMLAEEGEHGLKTTMCAIPDEYQSYLETNREFSYKVAHYNQNFQMTLLTFPLMVGFLKVASKDYFDILIDHPIGKITIGFLAVLYVGGALIFNRLNGDVNLDL